MIPNQVDRIQVRQDDDGDYWIVITAEAGSIGISLSSNHQLNPNRIKLEAWAEDQLRRGEQQGTRRFVARALKVMVLVSTAISEPGLSHSEQWHR